MIKRLFILGILSLVLFSPGSVLAVQAPTGLSPCDGGVQPALAVWLSWEDKTVDHFELYYKKSDKDFWTDAYPAVAKYHLTGLTPSPKLPENPVIYQWYVVSCGDQDCNDSAPSSVCFFITPEWTTGGDTGGDDGKDGKAPGGVLPIELTNPLKADTLEEVINSLINFFFVLAMILAPLMIVIAGFVMVTAAGDPAKINRAKQIILWTAIAIAIILFAKGLPSLIQGVLGG